MALDDGKPNTPRCFTGFIALFGTFSEKNSLRLPDELQHLGRSEVRGGGFHLLGFGEASSTQEWRLDADSQIWFKSRPFSIDGDRPVVPPADAENHSIEQFLYRLDGKFSLLLLQDSGAAIVATDLIGAGAIFYAQFDGCLLVSTHLGVLVDNAPCDLGVSNLGTASVLCAWAAVDGQTHFERVRRLSSGEYLQITPLRQNEENILAWRRGSYASLADVIASDHSEARLDMPELAMRFDHHLHQSLLRERLSSDWGIFLSDGRDSTALAFGIRDGLALEIPSVTYGDPNDRHVLHARRMAHALGFPHHIIEPDWSLADYAARIVHLAGGLSGLQSSYILGGYEHAAPVFSNGIVGFLGDAVTGGHLPKKGFANRATAKRLVCHNGAAPLLNELYAEEMVQISEIMDRKYDALAPLPPHQRSIILDLTIRQASWISQTFDLAESFLPLAYPFFSRELLRFTFNLPQEMLYKQRLYSYWLKTKRASLMKVLNRTGYDLWNLWHRLGGVAGLLGKLRRDNESPAWRFVSCDLPWVRSQLSDLNSDSGTRLLNLAEASLLQFQENRRTLVISLAILMARKRILTRSAVAPIENHY